MADSTTDASHNFLHSWESTETIDLSQTNILCQVCKISMGPLEVEHQLQSMIDRNIGRMVIIKSVVLLVCSSCNSVTHLHCFGNSAETDFESLVIFAEQFKSEPFTCIECQ